VAVNQTYTVCPHIKHTPYGCGLNVTVDIVAHLHIAQTWTNLNLEEISLCFLQVLHNKNGDIDDYKLAKLYKFVLYD